MSRSLPDLASVALQGGAVENWKKAISSYQVYREGEQTVAFGGGGGKYPRGRASKDCREIWFMERLVKTTSNKSNMASTIRSLRKIACKKSSALGAQSWPNGNTAKYSDGTWRYPNGNTAKFTDGTWRYPNGNTAKFSDRTWRYPNGNTARFSDGTWRYPNGNRAGSVEAIQSWACSKLGDRVCDSFDAHRKSSMPEWRMYTLVNMAWRAYKK